MKAKETAWVPFDGDIPAQALVINLFHQDRPTYVVRARSNDSWIVTTIGEDFSSHADFYGEEMLLTECEILISNDYL